MSVVAGFVSYANVANSPQLCRRLLDAQAAYSSGPTALRALGIASFAGPASIHTPSSGTDRAPSDPRWLIAADVRLDNRSELVSRLRAQDLAANPNDAAILLASWKKWGEAALDLVVGDYAFAIYDDEDRTLILARDPSGDRPLFYSRSANGVAFASMPSGLLAIATHQPSLHHLAAQLAGRPADGDESVFTGIERVRPGELVRITSTTLARSFHWRPQVHHHDQPGRDRRLSDADYVEQYRSLLTEAVACRLPVDGSSVAAQLSAGWDSNAVTATAAQLRPSKVTAFTAAPLRRDLDPLPRGRIADESEWAAITARHHGIEHVIVRETAPLFDVVRCQSTLLQMPATNGFNLAWWEAIRSNARERGATHLLTGELGNYTLNAGGLPILAEWARRSMWRTWWREARAAARRPDVRWRGILINSFGHRLPPPAMAALRRSFLKMPPPESISFLRKDWRDHLAHQAVEDPRPDGDPYLARLEEIRRNDPGVFRKSALAQAGIVELDPTADRRLIEFSLTLPPEQLFRGGVSRPLARAALADRVPAQILDLKVRGFQGADWYLHFHQSDAHEVLEEIEPHPAVRDLLDIKRMKRAIEAWPDRDWNSERHLATYSFNLLGALATGIFLTQFSDQPS